MEYKLLFMDGFKFVLRPVKRTGSKYPDANFRNTNMGLCGFLKDGETLAEFAAKHEQKIASYGEDRD